MRNVDYYITRWPETNKVEIMYNTKNNVYVKQINLDGIPVDEVARSLIEKKKEKEKVDEMSFNSKLCVWCIWKYRKDSIVSKLPKDVLKLLTERYISPKKEQWWITNKRKQYTKDIMYIVIMLSSVILLLSFTTNFL